ncbi:MAG: hypothetical protein F6K55_25475 [Moorea sp. SIO4A3]|nr:hypothetical protein [Moorena sp. SIO4A3]
MGYLYHHSSPAKSGALRKLSAISLSATRTLREQLSANQLSANTPFIVHLESAVRYAYRLTQKCGALRLPANTPYLLI